eukprot:SAG11_NODE_6740_length_1256_cov_1.764909_2_plen_253_part_00
MPSRSSFSDPPVVSLSVLNETRRCNRLVGHAAVRTWVLGARANAADRPGGAEDVPVTAEEMSLMRKVVEEAVASGAVGLSSSRVSIHRDNVGVLCEQLHGMLVAPALCRGLSLPAKSPCLRNAQEYNVQESLPCMGFLLLIAVAHAVPGSLASHEELLELGAGVVDGGGGVFELASTWNLYDDFVKDGAPDPAKLSAYGKQEWQWLDAMANMPGLAVTTGGGNGMTPESAWSHRGMLKALDSILAKGGDMCE